MDPIIPALLKDIPIPRMVKVRQIFDDTQIADLHDTMQKEFVNPAISNAIKPNMRIAVAVGSRGMAEIKLLVKVTVEEIKKRGAHPFIVPAMGSHGGASAEGQRAVLHSLGITEEFVGCPIESSMETVKIGSLANGLAIFIDKNAYEADGIVLINRIKAHPDFTGPCESGLAKMLSIGLGNQKGADSCHAYGFKCMAENVVAMAKAKIEQANVLFGIATVENAYDKVAIVEVIPAASILEREQQLLPIAKSKMAKILLDPLDVLVVQQIGKEISGEGMDPHVTGRFATPYAKGGATIGKVVVLDLTEKTHGNSNGMGQGDYITRNLFDKVNFSMIYVNSLTATITEPIKVPMVLDSEQQVVQAAIKTSNSKNMDKVRVMWIKDTLHLGEMYVSEALLDEVEKHPNVEILSEPFALEFSTNGEILNKM